MKTKTTLGSLAMEANESNTIPSELIQKLVDNYRKNQMTAANKELGITDSHSIWFDLPRLKSFIAAVENEARNINPDVTDEDLGIRFYYAAYPKTQDWGIMENHPVDKEYAQKHTLVMIPTLKRADENGEMLDFDFEETSGEADGEASRSQSPTTLKVTFAGNHGTLAPPSNTKAQSF
ncbi:MAG: hypothetical protein LBE92_14005 [Chryseobacterium sp.]|jgi:hypothetical protein|uniref:hypothetical protein n=1 Tax=Chryseobacterium sp. TaxID=1871047 RepID=UPI002836A84C|nr:hypothetical protein [Chryseobacterium sp.]MDR2237231.1 hypothetical protein [Chryseobacterium sp.]